MTVSRKIRQTRGTKAATALAAEHVEPEVAPARLTNAQRTTTGGALMVAPKTKKAPAAQCTWFIAKRGRKCAIKTLHEDGVCTDHRWYRDHTDQTGVAPKVA